MKSVSLFIACGVGLPLFIISLVHGAVLPEKSGDIGRTENDQKFEDLNSLSSPLVDYMGNTAEILNEELKSAVPSVSTFLKRFIQSFQISSSSVHNDLVLDRIFQGMSSDDCKGHILEWLLRMSPDSDVSLISDKEKWVLQMLDAWGKLPEGILSGHVSSLGDFDECIDIEVKDLQVRNTIFPNISKNFEGRYCTAYPGVLPTTTTQSKGANNSFHFMGNSQPGLQKAVSVEELMKLLLNQGGISIMIPSVALCMPNSCSITGIQIFFANVFALLYETIPIEDPNQRLFPAVGTCEEKNKSSFSAGDITMITILSLFAGVSLVSGVVDYWQRHRKHNENAKTETPGLFYKYLMAFSLYTNTKKLLSTRKSPEDLSCLHGIRFFSMCWVVLGHSYDVFGTVPQWNIVDMMKTYEAWTIMPIMNGTFSVDTFFVMSGLLVTYNILKMLDKSHGRFNVIMFYIHRYIRLTPTYAILVGLLATLVVYTGNGPSWIMVDMQAEFCRKNWWLNLLYINNIVKTSEMCNSVSWYLSNDMQFYILSPLIVYPIWKWPKVGLSLLGLYTIASCISPVLVVRYANAPPAALLTRLAEFDGFTDIYYRPWPRIQTFLVGVWIGWLLHKTRGKRVNLPKIAVAGLWLCSTVLALVVIYSIRNWFDPSYEIPKAAGYFYAGLSRFSWGIVVSWVIFACVKGYGGIVNTFLSWKVFMPLGRLTFSMYLTSMHLQIIFHTRLSVPLKYDTYTMVNLFFAHMVVSLLVGFLCTVLFESPFIILQKLIFEGHSPKSKPQLRQKNDKSSGENAKVPSKRYGIFYEKGDTVIDTQVDSPQDDNVKEEKVA